MLTRRNFVTGAIATGVLLRADDGFSKASQPSTPVNVTGFKLLQRMECLRENCVAQALCLCAFLNSWPIHKTINRKNRTGRVPVLLAIRRLAYLAGLEVAGSAIRLANDFSSDGTQISSTISSLRPHLHGSVRADDRLRVGLRIRDGDVVENRVTVHAAVALRDAHVFAVRIAGGTEPRACREIRRTPRPACHRLPSGRWRIRTKWDRRPWEASARRSRSCGIHAHARKTE